METMTPAQLGIILAATALVLIGRWLFESRASWLPWVAAIWQRYFYVRLPQSPDELSSVSQAADSEIMSPTSTTINDRSESAGNVHSDAVERPTERTPEWSTEGAKLTKEQWLTFLARSEMLDNESQLQPFAKANIAKLVGIRAEDAIKMIDDARGVAAQPKSGDPQFVKVGEREQYQRINAKPIR